MSLGRKVVVLFLLLGASLSIGSFAVLNFTLSPAFQILESESTEAALLRVDRALEEDLDHLRNKNMEYSRWNLTYAFAMGGNDQFASDYLSSAQWRSSNVHLLAIFDINGRRLFGKMTGHAVSSDRLIDEEFSQPLERGHSLVTRTSVTDSVAGIIETRSGIMQVTSYPILKEDGTGPMAGSLIVGRYIDDRHIKNMAERTTATIRLHLSENQGPTVNFALAGSGSLAGESVAKSDVSMFGYHVLKDIYGNTVANLAVHSPRNIAHTGNELTHTVSLMILALCAFFLVVSSLFMRRLVVLPVQKLTNQMLGIRATGELTCDTQDERADEIGLLSCEFSAMTSRLSKGQEKIRQARDAALATSKAKSDFLARMSHEIRTPMNGVLGMTELLRNTKLLPRQAQYADAIYESAHSLLKVINDILDFSKIEAGKIELENVDVHLGALVDETVQSLAGYAHAQKIELMSKVPQELNRLIKTDPVRLRQVLNNLISNAIKFTHDGEVIVRLLETNIEMEPGYRNVCFEVIDTGIGIAPERQEEIFESFTQAHGSTTRLYGGSGLGLSICKQIIEQLGGELSVRSAPNKGSVFTFSLTLQTSDETAPDAAAHMKCVAGRRVLIVDDNPTTTEILEAQLKAWRAQTDSIGFDCSAYAHLVAAHASGEPYEVAILDRHFSNDSALELAAKIRSDPKLVKLKLLLLNSIGTPATSTELDELSIAGQLTRPVSHSQLYNALAVIMDEPGARPTELSKDDSTARQLSGRVLVVEDNEVNRLVALSMLETLGLTVVLASDGLEAVEKYSSDVFDLILMDCQLPVMDGLKATETIRLQEEQASQTYTPIIAATANALDKDKAQCLASGMDNCLIKPFTSEQLHAVLALYLPVAAAVGPVSVSESSLCGASQVDEAYVSDGIGAVIDKSTLAQLSKLQQLGSPNIVRKLLSLYLQSSIVIKERLSVAIENADSSVVRETAHALKSSSQNVGAKELADLCKNLEGMGRNGALADPPALQAKLETEYGRVVTAVNCELRGMTV